MPKESAREPGVMDYDYTAAAGSRQTYLHGNLIGTTEATSGASAGSPPSAGRAVYTAFGERVYANGVGGGRYGYAGAWGYQAAGTEQCGPVGETYSCDPLEELGWLHVGERYYDPACGRFVQRDPIGIAGGWNVYAYVDNAPSLAVDPDGLDMVDFRARQFEQEIVDKGFDQAFLDRTGGARQIWIDRLGNYVGQNTLDAKITSIVCAGATRLPKAGKGTVASTKSIFQVQRIRNSIGITIRTSMRIGRIFGATAIVEGGYNTYVMVKGAIVTW